MTAHVTNPEGNTASLDTYLHSDTWAEVNYPSDAYDMWSGPYTVTWTTSDEEFLACHGFRVEQISGE